MSIRDDFRAFWRGLTGELNPITRYARGQRRAERYERLGRKIGPAIGDDDGTLTGALLARAAFDRGAADVLLARVAYAAGAKAVQGVGPRPHAPAAPGGAEHPKVAAGTDPRRCGTCGQPWGSPACGPTHATDPRQVAALKWAPGALFRKGDPVRLACQCHEGVLTTIDHAFMLCEDETEEDRDYTVTLIENGQGLGYFKAAQLRAVTNG